MTARAFDYHQLTMPESECPAYQKLKDRETRAHAAWTSHLFRNEVKPKLSEKAKRKHQKEEMEAYQQAHKARLSHVKTCPICSKRSDGAAGVSPAQPGGDARLSNIKVV
jgi:hypothetical protein